MVVLHLLNPFRSIIALLLAFLVAVPLCCCSFRGAEAVVRPSCCAKKADGQGKPDKAPHVCACKNNDPRDEVKGVRIPTDIITPFVPVVQDLSYLAPPVELFRPMAVTPRNGCDPPRFRLAIYSRWLI